METIKEAYVSPEEKEYIKRIEEQLGKQSKRNESNLETIKDHGIKSIDDPDKDEGFWERLANIKNKLLEDLKGLDPLKGIKTTPDDPNN